MLTSWTNKEHTPKRRINAVMSGVCLSVGLGLSSAYTFVGRLDQTPFINSRRIRH